MYVNITGSANNKDVYIYQSFRKENGKTSSHIYKKLGKMNDLLAQFDNDKDKMMAWARNEAKKETELYNLKNGKVSVDFSQGARILKNEQRLLIPDISFSSLWLQSSGWIRSVGRSKVVTSISMTCSLFYGSDLCTHSPSFQ